MTRSALLHTAWLRSAEWLLVAASVFLSVMAQAALVATHSLTESGREHPDPTEGLTLLYVANALSDVAILVNVLALATLVAAFVFGRLRRKQPAPSVASTAGEVEMMLDSLSEALSALEADYVRTQTAVTEADEKRRKHEAILAMTRDQISAYQEEAHASARQAGRWPAIATYAGLAFAIATFSYGLWVRGG